MKKLLIIMTVLVMIFSTTALFAGDENNVRNEYSKQEMKNNPGNGEQVRQQIKDRERVQERDFTDEDGDGICDNCDGDGLNQGNMNQNKNRNTKQNKKGNGECNQPKTNRQNGDGSPKGNK